MTHPTIVLDEDCRKLPGGRTCQNGGMAPTTAAETAPHKTPRKPGRPRDPELENRTLAAARAVYAKRGWSGFTLDEVSKKSSMGKGSLYLRWANKAALLVDAVRAQIPQFADIDNGNIRDDLIEFSRQWMNYMCSDDGALTSRLSIDLKFYPELRKAALLDPHPQYLQATVALIRRAIDRGEIPADTSPALIGDVLAGAVSNHVRVTPDEFLDNERTEMYIDQLVTLTLAGVLNAANRR